MAGEVTNINRGVSRKQYLQEFIDVKNEIFTEANLNLPLYNGDEENLGKSKSVLKLHQDIKIADGIIITCPEYNNLPHPPQR